MYFFFCLHLRYVKKNIFTPLRMDDTYLMLDDIVQEKGDPYNCVAMPYFYMSHEKENSGCYCAQIPFGYFFSLCK